MAIDKNTVSKEAQKFAAKGQFDKAVLEWRKLLKDFPSDSSIYNTIGDLSLKKGDAKGKTEAVDAYYRAGTILAAEGFTSKAIAVFKKVLNIDPKKVEVHLALGDMNAEKGLTSNALESYKLAADHYKQSNEMRKALGIYQKMADLNPSNNAFKLKLADMYAKEGMKAEAIQAYLEAADVHMAKEAFQDARQIFEKALALDPNNKQVYHKAGIVYFKEGKFVEACKALKSVYEGDSSNKELAELYLDALTKAGRDTEVEELCKKLLSADAARTDLHEKLFHIYLARKEHNKALAEAAIVAEERLKSRDVSATEEGRKLLPGAGEAEMDEGMSHALADLKFIVADNPRFAQARRTLGDFYAKIGRGSDAAEEFVRAAEILIDDGDKDGARAALARALELAPDNAEAKQRLESLQAPQPAPVPAEQAVAPAPPVTPASPAALAEDPAITGAFTEIDVLVKYGLSSKALEQLEGLAKKFPESVQVRIKLRDLYGDQGNVSKAVAHMLVLAGLYTKRGEQDQAKSVLQSALELDPGNAEVQVRLGVAPSMPAAAPTAAEELTFEEPLGVPPSLGEVTTPSEEQPAGFGATPPELVKEIIPPGFADVAEIAPEKLVPEALAPEEITFGEPLTPIELPAEEPAATGEIAFEEPLPLPEIPEAEPLLAEEKPIRTEQPQPALEKPLVQPAAPVPEREVSAQEQPVKEVDLKEIWAEAEFYYQQGLFDEAKKHYAKIIQYNPSDKRAIDRLTEISREAEETQEFSKLAEAVDGLERFALPSEASESGEVLAASESDDEAVRMLMQEIAQLKKQTGVPSGKDSTPSAPPQAPVAGGEMKGAAVPARTDAPKQEQRAEEDFFDLGEELRKSGRLASPPERKEQAVKQSDDFFDLASELRDELSGVAVPPPTSTSAEEQSLDDIFEDFKKGVEQQAVKEDIDTHYNLGVAYKEMGLLDDAIAEFVLTPEVEPKFVQSRYMLGLCYMDKGEYQNAIAEVQSALKFSASQGVAMKDRVGMHYDLGLAYQLAGDTAGALNEFQKVHDADPGYRDAASKIKELQKGDFISLEQLKDDIEKEISFKFIEEGERIEREEKIRKNEKVRS